MRNSDMASLIDAAINSPIGSTPRKRAQKIVSIMKKVGAIDGSNSIQQRAMQYSPEAMQAINQMNEKPVRQAPVVFPMPPERRKAPVDGRGGYPDGQGGSEYGLVGDILNFPKTIAPGTAAAEAGAVGLAQYGIQNLNRGIHDTSKFLFGKAGTPFEADPYIKLGDTWGGKTFNNLMGNSQPLVSPLKASSAQGSWGPKKEVSASKTSGSVTNPFTGLMNSSATQKTLNGKTNNPFSLSYDTSTQGDSSSEPVGSEFSSLMEQFGLNEDPYANVSTPSVKSALEKNMSATGFAYSMMNDPEELRKIPGFENLPDDALPYGASLSGQVGALAETLRKESGLDAMLNDYKGMLDSAGGLEGDLTDYVRGRDEFLNETQGLIDDFKEKTTKMDMANPVIAQRAKQYNDFLYSVKGRQNKRYIEFVNQSLTKYQNDVQNKKAGIETVVKDLESQIDFKGNLAIDEYERIYTALVDTYNSALGLPELESSRQQAQAELTKTYAQTIKDATGVADETEYNETYQKQTKYLSELILDKDSGTLLPGSRSLNDLMMDHGGADSAIGTDYKKIIADVWTRGMKNDFNAADSTVSDIMSKLNQYVVGLDDYRSTWGDLGNGQIDPMVEAQYNNLKGIVSDMASSAIKSKISSDPEAIQELKEAVKAITNKKFWGGYISEEDFLEKFSSDKLDRSLLKTLYKITSQYIQSTGRPADEVGWQVFADPQKYGSNPGIDNMNEKEFVDNIMKKVSNYGI